MQKTYKGDDRFKLTEDFDVTVKDANKAKSHIPDQMLGQLSKKELEDFFHKDKGHKQGKGIVDTGGYSSLDDSEAGEIHWKHGIDLEKERG